jgi:cytochrome c oxidase subunit 3
MAETTSHQEQFGTPEAQREAAQLGMWIFLGTEILLFGGLFVAYAEYRMLFGRAFRAAGSHVIAWLGMVLTLVLITSSWFAARAVRLARQGQLSASARSLVGTLLLGVSFLVLHVLEYAHHAGEGALPGAWYRFAEVTQPGASLFFTLYYLMTGLHMLHVTVGVGVIGWVAWGASRGRYSAAWHTPVEVGTMYWHLVDIIWIFLFPLLYLVGQ